MFTNAGSRHQLPQGTTGQPGHHHTFPDDVRTATFRCGLVYAEYAGTLAGGHGYAALSGDYIEC